MTRNLLALSCLLLVGCIVFDKKSEAVSFHQFASPTAFASKPGPTVFIPRVLIPSAVRRANVVLMDDSGWVRVEDTHRWAGPPDRLIAETLGSQIVKSSGLPVALHTPSQSHLVLLITVDRLALTSPTKAILSLHFRVEKSDGELLKEGSGSWTSPISELTPPAFVKAQSNNLANAAAAISTELVSLEKSVQTSPQ